jgi:non-canonical (house-cleaning) NTP pyrophosphatase
MQLLVKGFNTKSNVEEQPVNGRTYEGAMNRLTHLKMLAKEMEAEDTLSVFVSMENGIFSEQVEDLQNPELFYDTERQAAWVDRCIVIIEVASRGIASAYSQGVTVPVSAVLASLQTGCSKTCGFFIENEYGFASKDWHGQMAGVSRKELMEEAIVSALKKI